LPIVPDSAAGAVALALNNRPEMVSLEQSLKAAKAGVLLAFSQRYPNFGVRAEVSEQSPTAFVNSTYGAVTLELKWSLLDAGKSEQDIKQARDSVSRLEALLSDARAGIELDVTQAWEKMREAQNQLELARQVVQARQATEQVTEKAYEVGRATVYEVENAQKDVRSAREAELDADYDLRAAGVEFQYAQGLGLPSLTPAGPIPKEPKLPRGPSTTPPTGERQP
jgi:outer membrane protein TolC